MIFGPFLALVALVVAIVAIAQMSVLRARLDDIEKLLGRSERSADRQPPLVSTPPPLPQSVLPPPVPPPPSSMAAPAPKQSPGITWESFVGVRLFAWVGGLAFFLGVVFFVKYSFDNNLISPRIRIAAGGLVGLALIAVGLLPSLRRFRIPAQSLIATGVLVCYADIYAAHSFYGLISLGAASISMWLTTAVAMILAERTDAPGILWLGLIGGFLTPLLFRTNYGTAAALFGYIAVLTCGIVGVSVLKRWRYFIAAAAVCIVTIEFAWTADFFGAIDPVSNRIVFFAFQGLFLLMAIVLARTRGDDVWTVTGAAIVGFAPLLAFVMEPLINSQSWDFGFLTLLLAPAGLIALGAVEDESGDDQRRMGLVIVAVALGLVLVAEWRCSSELFSFGSSLLRHDPLGIGGRMISLAVWHAAIFLVFAATPYLFRAKRTWPWIISAIAGPLQFWFVHHYLTIPVGSGVGRPVLAHEWTWLLPVLFAVPAAAGILYLVRQEGVLLSSGDNRLAIQGAALLTFISLIFPVQFQREWITLGWAVEGLGLIVLFRWLPNRRLRAAALIVLSAAFVRLALNPAVLSYHPRSHTRILNWYLYVYGLTGLLLFASGQWFGSSRARLYERIGPSLLYTLSGIVLFLLLNIEIADYFSIGPTLTFSFAGDFARDMTYTISWALFAFLLLLIGMLRQVRPMRFGAVVLLGVAVIKLFVHDLDSLNQLYRIGALVSVAIIAIVASFAYQRFLSPAAKQ